MVTMTLACVIECSGIFFSIRVLPKLVYSHDSIFFVSFQLLIKSEAGFGVLKNDLAFMV